MTDYIFDSFALTAFIEDEPGRQRVSEIIEDARSGGSRIAMTTVNLGETLYMAQRRRGVLAAGSVLDLVSDLPIEIVDADLQLTIVAARIKAVTPISYGDCFATALALERSAVLLTGDPEFTRMQHLITIDWLSRR